MEDDSGGEEVSQRPDQAEVEQEPLLQELLSRPLLREVLEQAEAHPHKFQGVTKRVKEAQAANPAKKKRPSPGSGSKGQATVAGTKPPQPQTRVAQPAARAAESGGATSAVQGEMCVGGVEPEKSKTQKAICVFLL